MTDFLIADTSYFRKNEIVHRKAFPTVPVTVEYSLTEKGKDFQTILKRNA
ncbi:winged helix-turn-helix transcriptional regulator [Paenibacillus ehimensis]